MPASVSKDDIRATVLDFFQKCNAPLKAVQFDNKLYAAAHDKVIQLGYPLDDAMTMKTFHPFLTDAVYATVASYPHLKDITIRAFIASYIALFSPISDYFADKPDPVGEFNSRLIRGAKQAHPLLDAYAHLLYELPKYWDPTMADMMRQSAMTFLTSMVVERQLKDAELPNVSSLTRSIRTVTGTSLIHVLFAFPSGVHPEIYLAAVPPMLSFVEYTNDILSFYKEELNGESSDFLSVRAKMNGTNKLEELRKTVADCVDAYRQIEQLARKYPSVCGPLVPCWPGYMRFHLSAPNYRLLELLEIQKSA